jgi:D-sedoheptulose 7-phosphate isomerase
MIINKNFEEHIAIANKTLKLSKKINLIANYFLKTLKNGGTLFWIGNGGSAADCQHLSTEFMVRFLKNRKPYKSISLTTDTSLITAHSNDFGYNTLFSRQIEALVQPKDLLIAISTSGNSQNIINACKFAKKNKINTVALLGNNGGKIKKLKLVNLIVPCRDTARIQEMHILIGHTICEIVERSLK